MVQDTYQNGVRSAPPPVSTQVLPGNTGNPTKSQETTNFLGEPGRTWQDLGGPGWKQLGLGISQAGLGELQKLVRGKVAGGWPAILTHNF